MKTYGFVYLDIMIFIFLIMTFFYLMILSFIYFINDMQQYMNSSKHNSFLSSHPQLTKRVLMSAPPKLRIPEQQYKKKKSDYYLQQQQMNENLRNRMQDLQHDNLMFKQSLMYFDPTSILSELSKQLQQIRNAQVLITQQIGYCQTVESTSTPQQYFLFKKNKRIQSFNQAINEIYEFVDGQREMLRKQYQRVLEEMSQVKGDIDKTQNQLNHNYFNHNHSTMKDNKIGSYSSKNGGRLEGKQNQKQQLKMDDFQLRSSSRNTENHRNQRQEEICQSRINVIVESTLFSQQYDYQPQCKDSFSQSESQSSQVDPSQLGQLQDEYKALLQTYQIISENNQIMTTQLFNSIEKIQDSIHKYHDSQTNKLYRELLNIKQDFSYMPLQHIIPLTQTQINYQIAPLIEDYKSKLKEIKSKLSTDLKRITVDILTPLHWQDISIQQYLKVDSINQDSGKNHSLKSLSKNNKLKKASNNKPSKQDSKKIQRQNECKKIQKEIREEEELISSLQSQLQQIMGDTMIFKQKEHELQLAMHNMRKGLKLQQQQSQTILF